MCLSTNLFTLCFQESHDDNPNLKPIIDRLAQLTYKGDQVALDGSAMVHIERLLPGELEVEW